MSLKGFSGMVTVLINEMCVQLPFSRVLIKVSRQCPRKGESKKEAGGDANKAKRSGNFEWESERRGPQIKGAFNDQKCNC